MEVLRYMVRKHMYHVHHFIPCEVKRHGRWWLCAYKVGEKYSIAPNFSWHNIFMNFVIWLLITKIILTKIWYCCGCGYDVCTCANTIASHATKSKKTIWDEMLNPHTAMRMRSKLIASSCQCLSTAHACNDDKTSKIPGFRYLSMHTFVSILAIL